MAETSQQQMQEETQQSPELQEHTHTQSPEGPQTHAEKLEELDPLWELDLAEVRLDTSVGCGHAGHTYSAYWHDTHVAAKVVDCSASKNQAPEEELLSEFRREGVIASKLRHPNIVRFHGAAITPPRYCLVFEFMDGGTLAHWIRSHSGPLDFFKLATDMAKGMHYLHSYSIMHRDLKSSNVLLDASGTAKISDFGLSCVLEASRAVDLTAETGTYGWMAPEVIRHEPYSAKADVYSFGVVLWELLAKGAPFRGQSPVQTAFAVAEKKLRPALPPRTPKNVRALIDHCWQQDPARRPDFAAILNVLPSVKQAMQLREYTNSGILYVP